MPVHHFYDETAGHAVIVAAMAERRPFWRSALLGAYVELVSLAGRSAYAAVKAGATQDHVDGVVNLGQLREIEPDFTDCLVAGMLNRDLLRYLGGEKFLLVRHPGLTHSKTAKQLASEAQHRKDTKDPTLTLPVRFRDGDQCRVCHVIVRWSALKNDPEKGTFDHVDPRKAAESPDDLVVCCLRCNGIRSNRDDADEFAPHQPAPEHPFYTDYTRKLLNAKGYRDPDGKALRPVGRKWLLERIDIRVPPAKAAPATMRDLAPSETPPVPPEWAWEGPGGHESHVCGKRSGNQSDTASQGQRPASPADTAGHRDLAPSETPQATPVPLEFGENSPKTRDAHSSSSPPDSRTKQVPETGGLAGREGRGGVLDGTGGGAAKRPRRHRGRRGRNSTPPSVELKEKP